MTACFLFRRPLLAVLERSYVEAMPHSHAVVRLAPALRQELQLAALLLLVAESDLRAPAVPAVWSLDASPWRGATVRAPATEAQSRALRLAGTRRGGYTRLAPRCRSLLIE